MGVSMSTDPVGLSQGHTQRQTTIRTQCGRKSKDPDSENMQTLVLFLYTVNMY